MVARSSTEAEYRGMVHGVCELLWIKRILRDLEIDQPDPISLHCDNEAAVKIANNQIQQPDLGIYSLVLRCIFFVPKLVAVSLVGYYSFTCIYAGSLKVE